MFLCQGVYIGGINRRTAIEGDLAHVLGQHHVNKPAVDVGLRHGTVRPSTIAEQFGEPADGIVGREGSRHCSVVGSPRPCGHGARVSVRRSANPSIGTGVNQLVSEVTRHVGHIGVGVCEVSGDAVDHSIDSQLRVEILIQDLLRVFHREHVGAPGQHESGAECQHPQLPPPRRGRTADVSPSIDHCIDSKRRNAVTGERLGQKVVRNASVIRLAGGTVKNSAPVLKPSVPSQLISGSAP